MMGNVTLEEITAETLREVLALEVSPEQRDCVAANAVSIAEAYFNKGAWFRAIAANDAPVGFIMLYDPRLPGARSKPGVAADEVLLWRFMIDRRFQGQGFGHKALDLLRETLRGRPALRRIIASYVPGPHGPEAFYLDYGFAKTGRLCHEGQEIEISIAP